GDERRGLPRLGGGDARSGELVTPCRGRAHHPQGELAAAQRNRAPPRGHPGERRGPAGQFEEPPIRGGGATPGRTPHPWLDLRDRHRSRPRLEPGTQGVRFLETGPARTARGSGEVTREIRRLRTPPSIPWRVTGQSGGAEESPRRQSVGESHARGA